MQFASLDAAAVVVAIVSVCVACYRRTIGLLFETFLCVCSFVNLCMLGKCTVAAAAAA